MFCGCPSEYGVGIAEKLLEIGIGLVVVGVVAVVVVVCSM